MHPVLVYSIAFHWPELEHPALYYWSRRVRVDDANRASGWCVDHPGARADLWMIPAEHVDAFTDVLERDCDRGILLYDVLPEQSAEDLADLRFALAIFD